jgi:hypothetical protein
MVPLLNERETEYVNTLMKRDRMRMRLGWLFMMLLVAGGIVFVITAYLTLRKMNDATVLWVTLPGFVTSLSLIVLSIVGVSWVKQQHLIASILKKFQQHSTEEAND